MGVAVAGVSWKRTLTSENLARIDGRMAPDSVTVQAVNLRDSSGKACLVELVFAHSAELPVPQSHKPIACIRMEAIGVLDADILAQIDFDDAQKTAYAEWMDSFPEKEMLEVTVSARTPGDFFRKSRELSKQLELAEVAMVYLLAPARGAQNVMEHLGYGSIATANRRVNEARKAGLIPPVGSPKEVYEEFSNALRDYWPKLQGGQLEAQD
jgi:hypothetical protein